SFVMQQLSYGIENALLIGTDQSNGTSSHSFRALGVQTHHENRLTEAWGLFLNSTGVSQHNAGCIDDASEFTVSQWLGKRYIRQSVDLRKQGFANSGVAVQRQDEFNIWLSFGQLR